MTVIDSGLRPAAHRPASLPFGLKRLLVRLRQRRRAVRTHIMLSRLDERLLYDIGLDPLDLREALKARQAPSALNGPKRRG